MTNGDDESFQNPGLDGGANAADVRELALRALRGGDFGFALQAVEAGSLNLAGLIEDLRVYQAELEIQNDELRESQTRTEEAVRRFSTLFGSLPLPALVVDELGVIRDCNQQAIARFELAKRQLRSHFFPRFLRSREQNRLRGLLESASKNGQGVISEVEMRGAGGTNFVGDIHAARLPDSKSERPQFAILVVDQTLASVQRRRLQASEAGLQKQSALLSKRVRELTTIVEISRCLQAPLGRRECIGQVLERIAQGMQYPSDTSVTITLEGVEYESSPGTTQNAVLQAEIRVDRVAVGMLSVGYRHGHDVIDCGPFFQEEQMFIEAVADLIGRMAERDRNDRKNAQFLARNNALLDLNTRAPELSESRLIEVALDQVKNLTGSTIAYMHFVDAERSLLEPVVWSHRSYKGRRLPKPHSVSLSGDGAWLESIRRSQPFVQNAPLAIPDDPNGIHPHFDRQICIPVLELGKPVMVVGVADKETAYDDSDLALLETIASSTWALLQRNRAHAQLNLNAEVFRFTREGVMVTDAETRIISVNEAFTRITGYREREVIGQRPNLLKSSEHDAAFYEGMWLQIKDAGFWQGEIWNRRANGEVYPQWLSISSARSDGAVRYIGIFMDISEHKHAQARIEFLASHDALTGLPNRSLLRDRAVQAFAQAQRRRCKVALVFVDLDHFKNINDSLGHPAGDQLLGEFAERLKACLRDTDTVSRLGGDEFVVMLPDIHLAVDVLGVIEKILRTMETPFEIAGARLTVSCSLGTAIFPEHGDHFDLLLKKADIALYQAKDRGRNNHQFFTEDMNARVAQRMRLETEMRQGLERGDFFLEYQPQFDLGSGRLVGAEALVRWNRAELGKVSPAEFIKIAEDSGIIVDLGRFVLRQACLQAKYWQDQGRPLRVAVNVSSVQFSRHNLLRLVRECLEESGLEPHYLELELTESILISDTHANLRVVAALREVGVKFSIDDFGTGYSSLSYLKRFAVDKLKIDQSFVQHLTANPDDAAIVRAIVSMANSLGILCIAEGVETPEQADTLRILGCAHAQGYLFSRPLSVAAFGDLLAENHVRAELDQESPKAG